MNIGSSHHYLGLAAEYRVISELLLRNYNPGRLMFDHGTDIVLDNGTKIQVKTTRGWVRQKAKAGEISYKCNLTGGRRRNHKIIEDDFDFVIFWLSGTDIFYIFPKSEVPNQWSIQVTPNGAYSKRNIYKKFKNNWDLVPY